MTIPWLELLYKVLDFVLGTVAPDWWAERTRRRDEKRQKDDQKQKDLQTRAEAVCAAIDRGDRDELQRLLDGGMPHPSAAGAWPSDDSAPH